MPNLWLATVGTAVWTATDPKGTWTATANSVAVSINAFPSYGPGFWCLAPFDSKKAFIYYSATADGTWTSVQVTPNTTYDRCRVVSYANGYWFTGTSASGTDAVYYSTSGPAGSWSNTGSGLTFGLTSVLWDGTNYSIGSAGVAYRASSPIGTWSSVSNVPTSTTIYCLQYGDGSFVAAGDPSSGTNYLWYASSVTGTWTSSAAGIATSGQNVRGLAYGNGYWVLTTYQGNYYYATTPGGTWTAGGATGLTNLAGDVAYADGIWTIIGQQTTTWKIATMTAPASGWTINSSVPSGTATYSSVTVQPGVRARTSRTHQAVNRASTY